MQSFACGSRSAQPCRSCLNIMVAIDARTAAGLAAAVPARPDGTTDAAGRQPGYQRRTGVSPPRPGPRTRTASHGRLGLSAQRALSSCSWPRLCAGRRQDPRAHPLCRRAVGGGQRAQQLSGVSTPRRSSKAIETKGESIAKGLQNLLHDLGQGHVSMTDESRFEVGQNVATSEGAVVYENELFQLIEYKPLTAKVYERPFLLVPPCHQQVLHPRPAARELADSLRRGPGPPHLCGQLAQS